MALFFLTLFTGCEQSPCVTEFPGEPVAEAPFDFITIHDDIHVVLTNTLPHTFQVNADIFYLRDTNMLIFHHNPDCISRRQYEDPTLFISYHQLQAIFQYSSGDISSPDTIITPFLALHNVRGRGRTTLKVNAAYLAVLNYAQGSVEISGRSIRADIIHELNNGIFFGKEFIVNHINIKHRGTNSIYIHPLESLSGTIYYGDVILENMPDSISVDIMDKRGELIYP